MSEEPGEPAHATDATPRDLVCPRCGARQEMGAECLRCGVIFAKLARSAGDGTSEETGTGPAPASVELAETAVGSSHPGAVSAVPGSGRTQPAPEGAAQSPAARALAAGAFGLLFVVAAVLLWPRGSPGQRADAGRAASARTGSPAPSDLDAHGPAAATVAPAGKFPAAPPLPAGPPAGGAAVRFPDSWYEGAEGYGQAVAEARADGHPVAIYFLTEQCPRCKELDGRLLSQPAVAQFLRAIVKVKINPEAGAPERVLANQYGVRDLPAFFIRSPAAVRQAAPVAPTPVSGFDPGPADGKSLVSPEEFIARCQQAAATG